ncbi:MAG: hypothetical protein ACMXYK_02115 [Candidatus Woesearchaeota archaeon]
MNVSKLWKYDDAIGKFAKKNFFVIIAQALFFFIGLFVLIFVNQSFVRLILQEGLAVYDALVSIGRWDLVNFTWPIVKMGFYFILYFFIMALVYSIFQISIWSALFDRDVFVKKTVKQLLLAGFLLGLSLLLHFGLSIVFLIILGFDPYQHAVYGRILDSIRFVIIVIFVHIFALIHAYSFQKISFREIMLRFFKHWYPTVLFLVYLILGSLLGMFFMHNVVLNTIFIGFLLCFGAMFYYVVFYFDVYGTFFHKGKLKKGKS